MSGAVQPRRLADFAGDWAIERRIDDQLTGKVGLLEGRATFERSSGGLRYVETGQLRLEGQAPMSAERAFDWRVEGGQIYVDFDDGRPFHRFDPSQNRANATHFCDPDDYRVIYTFTRWPDWRAEWRVSGPRKNYRMETTYRRV